MVASPDMSWRRLLLALSGVCAVGWILLQATTGDWFFSDIFCVAAIAMVTLPLLPAVSIGTVAWVALRVFKRQLSLADCLPVVVIVVSVFAGGNMPSKPAAMFWLHRGELVELAERATEECTEGCSIDLPPTSYYQSGYVYGRSSRVLVIEFLTGNFYLPLLYISTDDPEDVYDTCSAGGHPIERLEPRWYVCLRDWN